MIKEWWRKILKWLGYEDEPEPEPEPQPEPAPGPQDHSSLWKPVAETDGNLVVLLSATYTDDGDAACYVRNERGTHVGCHNGNRQHFRFRKPGAAYGLGVGVEFRLGDGRVLRWTVADGAQRQARGDW